MLVFIFDESFLILNFFSSFYQLVGLSDRSMLGSMFSFMRYTKKARHNPESEGIYLDDLKLDELDPEVAALYFPRNFKAPEKSSPFTGFQTGKKRYKYNE